MTDVKSTCPFISVDTNVWQLCDDYLEELYAFLPVHICYPFSLSPRIVYIL